MTKLLMKRNLSERSSMRAFLALSLCASMAAFGCTTDRNLGNGDPVVTPGSRTSPTSGTSVGSESESVPPPMMSTFSNGQVRTIRPQIARMTAEEAAAIMAQQQPRVRVLGPVSPGRSGRPYLSDLALAQQQPEARYSVNSTIYSAPTEAILSGAGEPVATNGAAATVVDTSSVGTGSTGLTAASTIAGSSVVTGTTASTGTNVTNAAAPVIAPSGSVVTPTSNAISAPTGFASVRTLSPTAAAVVNPPASISGSPAIATSSSSRTAGATATATRTGTTVSASSVSAPPTNVTVTNPVRVLTANGRLTITNTGTTRQP